MDDDEKDPGDVFAIPDLWRPSKWLTDVPEGSGLLFSVLKLDVIDENLPEIVEKPQYNDTFFSIPDLSFPPLHNLSAPVETPDLDRLPDQPERADIDIWLLPEEIPVKVANYHSWDSFDHEQSSLPCTPYITEAGPHVFDAAIGGERDYLHVGNNGYPVVDSKVYNSAVFALGLGRNSVLFAWEEGKQRFEPTLSRMRVSGYSAESLDGLLSTFLDCGNITKSLQSFVSSAYTQSTSQSQIALADSVSTMLSVLHASLNDSRRECKSLLQLQAMFQPPHSILTCFERIVKNTSRNRSDESMLSTIFEEIQLQEHRTDSMREILIEILSRVSHPWLEFVSEWLGLQREAGLPLTKDGRGQSFVGVADKDWIDELGIDIKQRDYVLDYDKVPSFIAPDDARALFEAGRSLRFLRDHHSDHPLARADIIASANPPSFEWKFSWQDIVAVEAKALQYEKDLNMAIKSFSKGNLGCAAPNLISSFKDPDFALDFFGKPEEEMQAHLLASIDTFNLPLQQKDDPDRLSVVLSKYLLPVNGVSHENDSLFSPPISLVPVLAFNPLISAQARIINGTCMRMFFNSHKLRKHLSLQRSFHLLGNGVFSSRLSHAIFDPELESAERHRGIARSGGLMGLRLGGRETWPPASSELRLALMGILTDSYLSEDQSRSGGYLEKSLPGDLSFAVRDMSEQEIEKCTNADSIEALDFLRLSYKPPPPLEAVITPMILFKYDQLFKLLLRVTRMLYVISSLFRDSHLQSTDPVSQRFRIEAQHFVSSVSEYFFDTGIESTWRLFERKLDQIEARINNDDENIAIGQNEGLDKLRDYHERVLDRIMFALLLRKRQQPVMQLLEEIFALVLQFSKISGYRASGLTMEDRAEGEIKDIYLKFRKKVGIFITVCRGLSEKKGYGDTRPTENQTGGLFDGDDLAEENTISHLLLRLDMSGHYSKTVKM